MRTIALVIFCFLAFASGQIEEIDEDRFVEIVIQVPPSERYEFLKTHILRGHELFNQTVDLQEELDDDSKLSLMIYIFLYNHHHDLEDAKLKMQLNDTVCLPSIGCIDPGDSGVRPSFKK
ncbi:hypothetical protein GWI33_006393 [Rhynchophorus ferrugineus]|uniref:Uncharacterized protein n=1 Tax=Rhynchophorus ferrugineus TaxID=354439 RepID=A0A834MDU3_RHYFE|nr:hypothetical protein GWI33_006393 [Rhynchophorus ferrugineus]